MLLDLLIEYCFIYYMWHMKFLHRISQAGSFTFPLSLCC
jgi:hypothetical protein